MKNTNKAITMVERALTEIARELDNPNLPETGPISRKQLVEFRNVLELMRKKLCSDEPIEKNDSFGYGLGQVIVDSWPYDNALGLLIISAEQEYKKTIRNAVE